MTAIDGFGTSDGTRVPGQLTAEAGLDGRLPAIGEGGILPVIAGLW